MDVTPELVRHVARLARVGLSDAEVAAMTPQLARILAHVGAIAGVDVAGHDASAVDAVPSSTLGDDVPAVSLDRREVLRNAPAHDQVFFLVPKVLED